ncbi:helix-turn-helix transcriptional regulator [bacterium]|nr:helix-turn-helix transcriptional regulator [bacterium]
MTMVVSLLSVAFGIVLFVASKLRGDLSEQPVIRSRQRPCLMLGIAMATCCAANQFCRYLDDSDSLSLVLQSVASVCYLLLMYLWFRAYVALEAEELESLTIWSTSLLGAVFLLGLLLIDVARTVLWILLPLASSALLSTLETNAAAHDTRSKTDDASVDPTPLSVRPLLWTCAGVALCSLAVNLPLTLVQQTALSGHVALQGALRLSGVVIAALLAIYCIAFANRINLSSFFKILFPLVVLGAFLASLPSRAGGAVGFCLCFSAQWMLYVFVWIYAAEFCQGDVRRAAYAFALTRPSFDLGGVLASAAAMALSMRPDTPGGSAVFVFFAGVSAFALVSAFPAERGAWESGNNAESTLLASLMAHRDSRIAERYGLSPRETEILSFLLRGYSTTAIRNELYIAKGTVDTYVQRVYRKCGVHSRQELLDLSQENEGSPTR